MQEIDVTELPEEVESDLILAELADYEQGRPDILALAIVASLARSIEPELLRSLRVELRLNAGNLPVTVSAESGLWSSSLVESRGSDRITLLPEASQLLRTRLQADPPLLEAARKIIEAAHRGSPQVLQWEERLVYLGLTERVADLHEQVLRGIASLRDGTRLPLSNWIAEMWPRLPREAAIHPLMGKLRQMATGMTLRRSFAERPADSVGLNWLIDFSTIKRRSLGVICRDDKWIIGDLADAEYGIEVPDLEPVELDVAYGRETKWGEHLALDSGTQIEIDGWREESIRVRTLGGVVYELISPGASQDLVSPRSFSYEIFISYAQLDNYESNFEGRVDKFLNALQKKIQRYLGRKPSVWMDRQQLNANQNFSSEISRALSDAAIFLPLLSPAYLNSAWCTAELDHFVGSAHPWPPWKISDRVFKVFLAPEELIGRNLLPDILGSKRGYEFFRRRDAKDEWNFEEVGPDDVYFHELLTDLAKEICRMLTKITQPIRGTIYISKPTADFDTRYLSIVRECIERGYEIVPPPRNKLPDNEKAFAEQVVQMLGKSDLSIHFFGKRSQEPDDAAEFSSQHIEYELAKAECWKGKLQSIVWAPRDQSFEDEIQAQFVNAEIKSKSLPSSIDIVRSDFVVFHDTISQRMEKIQRRWRPPLAPTEADEDLLQPTDRTRLS